MKGLAERGPATIGALPERLQIHHNGMVQLVNRLARRGMVARRQDGPVRRAVVIDMRPAEEAVWRRLTLYSIAEPRTEGPVLVSSLRRLVAQQRHTEGRNGKS